MRLQYYDLNIYQYGNEYKVIYFPRTYSDELRNREHSPNAKIGDRFSCSISRSKNAILGLGLCNEWQYFTTFTLDKRKYDRYNLPGWREDFSQFIRNQRRLHNYDFKYLLIPEMHQDGAWHMHGLISGVPWKDLSKFDPSIHPIDLIKKGYRYYPAITDRFGYNSFGKVRNQSAASRYVLKYVAKGMGVQDIDRGCSLYYCSQGLNRPEIVNQSSVGCLLTDVSFQNEYLASSWIKQDEYERICEYL